MYEFVTKRTGKVVMLFILGYNNNFHSISNEKNSLENA